jgi:hypothetical protein
MKVKVFSILFLFSSLVFLSVYITENVRAACSGGTVTCGHLAGSCACSISGAPCNSPGDTDKCPGGGGTCGNCSQVRCVGEYGVECSSRDTYNSCSNPGYNAPCGALACVADGGCYWGDVGGGCTDSNQCTDPSVPTCCNGTCQESCGATSHTCRFSIAGTGDASGNLLVGNTYTFTDAHWEGSNEYLSAVVSGAACYANGSDPNFWTNRLFWYDGAYTPGWPSPTWVPSQAGTYTLFCNTSESGQWACQGHQCLKAGGTLQTGGCGALSHMDVTVVNPTPSCTVDGPISVCKNASVTYSVTSTNASSGSEIWKSSTANQSWTNIRPMGADGYSDTTFTSSGTYYVICNAFGSGGQCSGNPWCPCSGWSDCGANDIKTVTVVDGTCSGADTHCPGPFNDSCGNPTCTGTKDCTCHPNCGDTNAYCSGTTYSGGCTSTDCTGTRQPDCSGAGAVCSGTPYSVTCGTCTGTMPPYCSGSCYYGCSSTSCTGGTCFCPTTVPTPLVPPPPDCTNTVFPRTYSWTGNTNATGYQFQLYRGGLWCKNTSLGAGTTSYNLTSCDNPGVDTTTGTITWGVAAHYSHNSCVDSAYATKSYSLDKTPPTVPPGLTATCDMFGVVTASWGASTDPTCSTVDSYWAQVSKDPTFATAYSDSSWANSWVSWTSGTSRSTTANPTYFVPGSTVYVHVRSRDGLDNQSAWSANFSTVCIPPTGTIQARAVVVDPLNTSCATIQGSGTGGIAGSTFSFNASSPSHPAPVPPAQNF